MKTTNFLPSALLSALLSLALLFAAFFSVATAQAQEQSDGATAVISEQRPEMPNLFFRKEQRRVLEAVRQGVVEEEDFDIEEFVPVVLVEDALPVVDEVFEAEEEIVEVRRRPADLRLDAYIVNRKNGKKVVWVNGREVDFDQNAEYLAEQGLVVSVNEEEAEKGFEPVRIEDGVLKADDTFLSAKLEARVGQVIGVEGGVIESLPVIRINKK